jgi:glutamate 5-kinase
MTSSRIATARRLVIKAGSALVTNNGEGLDLAAIDEWARQIAELRLAGKQVILVSSGAIACGMQRLGWRKRPRAVHELQAAAAVGQMGLAQVYERAFARYSLHTAQVLLTHDDLADRKRYLNARSTLNTCYASASCRSSTKTTRWSPTRSSLATMTRSGRWSPTSSKPTA